MVEVAKEELGGGVIVLLQIANKKEALGVVVVEGEQAAEVVVLLHVGVDKGEGWLNFETGVLLSTTTLVFLMLTSSGGRPPSSIFVTVGR